jgi:hypothetical protein
MFILVDKTWTHDLPCEFFFHASEGESPIAQNVIEALTCRFDTFGYGTAFTSPSLFVFFQRFL